MYKCATQEKLNRNSQADYKYKMKKFITIVLLIGALQLHAQPWSQRMANTVMTIWKDSMGQPGRSVRWTYEQGVVLKGIEGIWKIGGKGNKRR